MEYKGELPEGLTISTETRKMITVKAGPIPVIWIFISTVITLNFLIIFWLTLSHPYPLLVPLLFINLITGFIFFPIVRSQFVNYRDIMKHRPSIFTGTIDENYITREADSIFTRIPWDIVDSYELSKDNIAVNYNTINFMLFTKSMFESDEDWDNFKELLEKVTN